MKEECRVFKRSNVFYNCCVNCSKSESQHRPKKSVFADQFKGEYLGSLILAGLDLSTISAPIMKWAINPNHDHVHSAMPPAPFECDRFSQNTTDPVSQNHCNSCGFHRDLHNEEGAKMVAYNQRTINTKRHEYALSLPATGGDVEVAIRTALMDKFKAGLDTSGSDAVTVTSVNDEEIVIYWEEQS